MGHSRHDTHYTDSMRAAVRKDTANLERRREDRAAELDMPTRSFRAQLDERDRVPLFRILRRAYRYAVDTHNDNADQPETVRDYWPNCLDMAFEDAGVERPT